MRSQVPVIVILALIHASWCQGSEVNPADLYEIPASYLLEETGGAPDYYEFPLLGRNYRAVFFLDPQLFASVPVAARLNSDGTVQKIDDPAELEAVLTYIKMDHANIDLRNLPEFWHKTVADCETAAAKHDPSQADAAICLWTSGKMLFGLGLHLLFPASAPHAVSTLTEILTLLELGSELNDFYAALTAQPNANELLQAFRGHYMVDRDGFNAFAAGYVLTDLQGYVNRGVDDVCQVGTDGIKVLGWLTDTRGQIFPR